MPLKKIAYLLVISASIATISIGLSTMNEFSLGVFLFLFLSIIPYIIMAFVVYKSEHSLSIIVNAWLSILLAVLGTATLVYEIYFHKDAQSALSFVVIPVYQIFVFIIVSFIVSLIAKRTL